MPWGGAPLVDRPLTASLRGLWVSGYLSRAMADRAQEGGDPKTDQEGTTSDPGLASRRERGLNCQQTCYSRTSVDCSIRKGAGAQRPHCAKGRDPRTPASWRHLLLRVVAATACAQRSDVWEVRPMSLPSSSTVFTVGAGLHWTASEMSYLQCYFSGERRDPTDAVLGQVDDIRCCSTTGAWS